MINRPFDFPLGIRPWPNPLRLRKPLLKEGYTLEPLEDAGGAYRLTAMVGAAKLADLIRDYVRLVPDELFLVLEFYEDDQQAEGGEHLPTTYYSPYFPTGELMEIVEPYLPRLIHDGFVGFGLANNRAGVELFCSEEHVLTCFTDNHLRMTDLFARYGIPHREHLGLPSDFGHDHLSLLCHPRRTLPEPFAAMSDQALDFVAFCRELVEELEMYRVEESLSFFLTRKDQDQIAQRLAEHPEFEEFVGEDFGILLFDWNDFVTACEEGFDGDLEDYRFGLKLRDVVQFVIEGVPDDLRRRLGEIIGDPDRRFRALLGDQRRRIDPPTDIPMRGERFWCNGIIAKQGTTLRRDLIRSGWFAPT